MRLELTKHFPFSASYASGGKIYGHNYLLSVTLEIADERSESAIENRIDEELISKMHSKDLGLDVAFLKGVAITDAHLLTAFWPLIEKVVAPSTLVSLELRRDKRTSTRLAPEGRP